MKPVLLWLAMSATSTWGGVLEKPLPVLFRVNKLTRTLGVMQHAANSRVNCKTVRTGEDGLSMRRNPIL